MTLDDMPIIEIYNISKVFETKMKKLGIFTKEVKKVEALKSIKLEINSGEIFGLLGPNGAGKTTLIKILTTLLLPTSGNFSVNGYDGTLAENERNIKASIGIMLMGERSLYWKLTAIENLEYFSALYHIPKKYAKERIEYLKNLLDFGEFANRPVETLSSGQKMKIVFARALLNNAPILLLDEPTNTLDVKTAHELRTIIKKINVEEGKTIVYCSHIMSEIEQLCDRCCIIDHGSIIALGTPEELRNSLETEDVVQIDGIFKDSSIKEVENYNLINQVTLGSITSGNGKSANGKSHSGQRMTFSSKNSRDALPTVLDILLRDGCKIEHIYPKEPTLEDVFISLTGRSLGESTVLN